MHPFAKNWLTNWVEDENLKAHLLKHSRDKLNECSTCDQTFSTELELQQHSKVHSTRTKESKTRTNRNKKYKKKEEKKVSSTKPKITRFPCPNCGVVYSKMVELAAHLIKNYGDDNTYKCAKDNSNSESELLIE